MRFSFLTLHSQLIEEFANTGLIGRAVKTSRIELEAIGLRDYADPPHFQVDDKPYGGGPGMLMSCPPIVRALRAKTLTGKHVKRILLSAKGRPFDQSMARHWCQLDQLVFICGRYEGVDERVAKHFVDEEIRVGDFVAMGGEAAAFLITEAVARLLPGVLGNEDSFREESFSEPGTLEFPQYTRPQIFEGYRVPEVLISGDHEKIKKWRSSTP